MIILKTEIVIAGFGGQGVLTLGVILANAAVKEDKNTTWVPSYGPEMRGGTANCQVIVSNEDIGSAIISEPDITILFNKPSVEKFEARVKKGGTIILNSSLIDRRPKRDDVKIIEAPFNEIAKNNPKVINMIALGMLIKLTGIITLDSAIESLKDKFSKEKIIDANKAALQIGQEYVK